MCKHEFEQFCIGRPTTWGLQTLRFADLCVFCGESRYETNLKQQLATANARVAEMEHLVEQEKLNSFTAVWKRAYDDCRCPVCGNDEWHKPGCEFAEIVEDAIENKCSECNTNQRVEQAEARMKRMEDALREIIDWCKSASHEDGVELQYVLRKAKAALEERPTAESGAPFDEYCPNPDKEDKK